MVMKKGKKEDNANAKKAHNPQERKLDEIGLGDQNGSKGKSPLLNETYLINATFIHLCNVLPHRRGERMVRTTPPTMGEKLLILICPSEQRELCDP